MKKEEILVAVAEEVKVAYGSEMLMGDGSKMAVRPYLDEYVYPYLDDEDFGDGQDVISDLVFEMIELDCSLDIDFRF